MANNLDSASAGSSPRAPASQPTRREPSLPRSVTHDTQPRKLADQEAVKRVREIIKDRAIPVLPCVIDRLLQSRDPKVLSDALRLLLPYVAHPLVPPKNGRELGFAEKILFEIQKQHERERSATIAPSSAPDFQPRDPL